MKRLRRSPILSCLFGLLLLVGGALSVEGYSLMGYAWPEGAEVTMHLQLSRAAVALQDGSASWNASAADALNIWNQYCDSVKFVSDSPSGSSNNDGINQALFSKTIYGDTWP